MVQILHDSISNQIFIAMNIQRNRELIEQILSCSSVCDYCAASCLEEENIEMLRNCIKLNLECAEICRATSIALSRGSSQAETLLNACVDACQRCADECSQHDHDHCAECAETCENCAEACSAF
jgi:hypothetical protein